MEPDAVLLLMGGVCLALFVIGLIADHWDERMDARQRNRAGITRRRGR